MEAPEEVGCCSLEENLGLLMRADLQFLTMACMEAIDPIYVIFGWSIMFTILKGLEIFSRPSIPQEYLSFLVVWHVLVRLLSCLCRSHIVRLLKRNQPSGLWVIGLPLLVEVVGGQVAEVLTIGIDIRDCEAKYYHQFGVSVKLEERWEFVLA